MGYEISSVLEALEKANRMAGNLLNALDVDDRSECAETCESVIDLCSSIRDLARKYSIELRKEPRTERQMINLIVKEIEAEPKPMRKKKFDDELPGGVRAAALRRANGKCELCDKEWQVSIHHVIPRSDGGLDELENLMVLCKGCHDDVEDKGHNSRSALFRYGRTREMDTDAISERQKTIAEKSAATKAKNAIEQRIETEEINEWADQWKAYAGTVSYKRLDEPEIERPEKLWHVAVYGGGRAMYEELLRQSQKRTKH